MLHTTVRIGFSWEHILTPYWPCCYGSEYAGKCFNLSVSWDKIVNRWDCTKKCVLTLLLAEARIEMCEKAPGKVFVKFTEMKSWHQPGHYQLVYIRIYELYDIGENKQVDVGKDGPKRMRPSKCPDTLPKVCQDGRVMISWLIRIQQLWVSSQEDGRTFEFSARSKGVGMIRLSICRGG